MREGAASRHMFHLCKLLEVCSNKMFKQQKLLVPSQAEEFDLLQNLSGKPGKEFDLLWKPFKSAQKIFAPKMLQKKPSFSL